MNDQLIKPAVYIALMQEGHVLLQRRLGTGYADGKLSLIAGHLNPMESATSAAARELAEETSVTVPENALHLAGLVHRPSVEGTSPARLDMLFVAWEWSGTPRVTEPESASELVWVPLDPIPSDVSPEMPLLLEKLRTARPHQQPWFERAGWRISGGARSVKDPEPTARVLRKLIAGRPYEWNGSNDLIRHADGGDQAGLEVYRRASRDEPLMDLCVELTTRCNLSCQYCFSESGPGLPFVHSNFAQLASHLEQQAPQLMRVCIAGGEPLMHPDIERVLELPRDYPNIGFVLNTNGTVRADLDPLIVRTGWLVAISLHGSEGIHNEYTRSNTHSKAYKRIEGLSARTAVHIYSVLHSGFTPQEVDHLVSFAARSRVRQLRFIVPRPFGRLGSMADPSVIDYARRISREYEEVVLKDEASFAQFLTSTNLLRRSN